MTWIEKDKGKLKVYHGDCLKGMVTMKPKSIQTVVTSPPYYQQRDFQVAPTKWPAFKFFPMPGLPEMTVKQMECDLGLEADPMHFVGHLVYLFRLVREILRDDGTVWLNLGDKYADDSGTCSGIESRQGNLSLNYGSQFDLKQLVVNRPNKSDLNRWGVKPKDKLMIPHRVALALQADGWYLRNDIVWHKPSPNPSSRRDNLVDAHEFIFLLAKSKHYFHDQEAIKTEENEDGIRPIKRTVWTVATRPYKGAHFAVFPPKLIEPAILAGSSDKCCAACGTPYRRLVKRDRIPTRPGLDTKVDRINPNGDRETLGPMLTDGKEVEEENVTVDDGLEKEKKPSVEGNRDRQRHVTKTETIGFEPACQCKADQDASTVFDPFGGSGTTAEVARRLGRKAVICEIGEQYIEQILNRNSQSFLKLE